MNIAVIIAAAGASTRMGEGSMPKQYMLCNGMPVLARSVSAFYYLGKFSHICVCVPAGDEDFVREMLERYGLSADSIVCGAAERQGSVLNALSALPEDTDRVLVHDAARPFVSAAVIARVCAALDVADAVVPAVRPKNTIRTVEKTLDRSGLFEVQTPQGFSFPLLMGAYRKAAEDSFIATDDASLTERLGVKTRIVEGDYANIKITTPEDIPMNIRSGMGYDVHRLAEGRPLMLGCVRIPFDKGLLGHSDADVIAHAIADAMLGAAALGDVGRYFPDSDPACEGLSGSAILSGCVEILKSAGFTLLSADATLVAEKPKIAPYAESMRKAVAEAIGLDPCKVSIKATTEEGLGVTGGGNAMSAYAIVTIKQ